MHHKDRTWFVFVYRWKKLRRGHHSLSFKFSLKTLHLLQIFILVLQSRIGSPAQTVPLINQQREPALNSHAGQVLRVSEGHFRIFQQGRANLCLSVFSVFRSLISRSMWTGTFRHPCSKLWIPLREIPRRAAICLCVFWSSCRDSENFWLSTLPLRWEGDIHFGYFHHKEWISKFFMLDDRIVPLCGA